MAKILHRPEKYNWEDLMSKICQKWITGNASNVLCVFKIIVEGIKSVIFFFFFFTCVPYRGTAVVSYCMEEKSA